MRGRSGSRIREVLSMDARVVSRIRMILWVVLVIVIAILLVHGDAIGAWFMDMLTSGTDSQLQQLLR